MNDYCDCLVLTQYRQGDSYNDFIGKFYHFPTNSAKNYAAMFEKLPVEFIYYEPIKNGEGGFYGYGIIDTPPFKDKQDNNFSFVEIIFFTCLFNLFLIIAFPTFLGTVIPNKRFLLSL